MSKLVVYEVPGCPFCAKVTSKLDALGVAYETKTVPRSRRDRTEVKEISGQTGVPVLVDDAHGVEGMAESSDIVAYLEATYGDDA
ncbi:MAG: glutaredoxin family protein [Halobacteriota archaeon]